MKIICVGKMKEKGMKALEQEYLKRLQRFNKCEIIELKEANPAFEEQRIIDDESSRLLQAIKATDYVVLFDVAGEQIDSLKFAAELAEWGKDFVIVIGGSLGFNDLLRKRANRMISMSKMTFPHLLARIMILEQVYRGYKIINHQTYHK